MYESEDIVKYLVETYDAPTAPLWSGPLSANSGRAGRRRRAGRGGPLAPRAPERPLELWSFEARRFARFAREALSELELPYVLHNVAQGSSGREAFACGRAR